MNKIVQSKGFFWQPEDLEVVSDIVWICPKVYNGIWTSKDGLLCIDGNKWIFKKGFKFDGCTGVWSGNKVKDDNIWPIVSHTKQPVRSLDFAAMIHDACYRYMFEIGFPYNKHDADCWFRDECKKARFDGYKVYYFGVELFGYFPLIGRWWRSEHSK